MTSHVGGIFQALYYGEENYSLLLEPNIGLASRIIQEDENKHAVIYLDTIGTEYKIEKNRISRLYFRACKTDWRGTIQS